MRADQHRRQGEKDCYTTDSDLHTLVTSKLQYLGQHDRLGTEAWRSVHLPKQLSNLVTSVGRQESGADRNLICTRDWIMRRRRVDWGTSSKENYRIQPYCPRDEERRHPSEESSGIATQASSFHSNLESY